MKDTFRRPFVFSATDALEKGTIVLGEDHEVTIVIPESDEHFVIPLSKQYDVTQATIFGLNERLTSGANSPLVQFDETKMSLREAFNREWEKYEKALSDGEGFHFRYGSYAYYFDRNELVHYANAYWHRVVSVATSSKLMTDPEDRMSWEEIQNEFMNTNIGIAGCSVGSRIAHAVMMDIRPSNIKIADKNSYKMENINRVRASYWDIVKSNADKRNPIDTALNNKAVTVAKQIYSIDPFVAVHLYESGLDEKNIDVFFDGSDSEPALDYVFDEVDDPRTKLLIRQKARERGVPVVMMTDIGSCVQVDINRYDLDSNLPLALNIEDRELIKSVDNLEQKAGDRGAFFEFVDLLIGTDYRNGQMKKIIELDTEIPTATMIPQLGSTAMAAGGVGAEIVARLALGYALPYRMMFNKQNFESTINF